LTRNLDNKRLSAILMVGHTFTFWWSPQNNGVSEKISLIDVVTNAGLDPSY